MVIVPPLKQVRLFLLAQKEVTPSLQGGSPGPKSNVSIMEEVKEQNQHLLLLLLLFQREFH